MSLKSKIIGLEKVLAKQFPVSGEGCEKELLQVFSGWADEELEEYATTGIKPKPVPELSAGASEFLRKKFADWTNEELEIYATTGEKPARFAQKPALSAH